MAITSFKRFVLSLALPVTFMSHSLFADVTPKMNYILDGKLVPSWNASTGDPEKWWSPLTELKGESGSGKLVIEPAEFKTPGDAFKLTWIARKKVTAQFSLGGNQIDIKSLENNAALVISMRLLTSPDKPVNIGMSCGDKCKQGKVDVSSTLKKLKKGEWIAFPIALNCFSTAGVDLSKITSPFEISTEGKLSIEITNVRLEKLGPDEKSCVSPQ
jgi:hypothetical protein